MPFKTKEQRAAYNKIWYQKNKEKQKKKAKKDYQENKEEKLKYQKEYQQTPAGKKTHTIGNWKYTGLIHPNVDELYDKYLDATHCEYCGNEFQDTTDRHMDHCHKTGKFRAFLCRRCNLADVLNNGLCKSDTPSPSKTIDTYYEKRDHNSTA